MLNVANGLQPELAAQFGEDNDDGLMNHLKTTVPVPPYNTSQADRDQLLLSSLQHLLSIFSAEDIDLIKSTSAILDR